MNRVRKSLKIKFTIHVTGARGLFIAVLRIDRVRIILYGSINNDNI